MILWVSCVKLVPLEPDMSAGRVSRGSNKFPFRSWQYSFGPLPNKHVNTAPPYRVYTRLCVRVNVLSSSAAGLTDKCTYVCVITRESRE